MTSIDSLAADNSQDFTDMIRNGILRNQEILTLWHQYQQTRPLISEATANIEKNISLRQVLNQGLIDNPLTESASLSTHLSNLRVAVEAYSLKLAEASLDYERAKKIDELTKLFSLSISDQEVMMARSDLNNTTIRFKQILGDEIPNNVSHTGPLFKTDVPQQESVGLLFAEKHIVNFAEFVDSDGLDKQHQSAQAFSSNCDQLEQKMALIYAEKQQIETEFYSLKQQLDSNSENQDTLYQKKQNYITLEYQGIINDLHIHHLMGDLFMALGLVEVGDFEKLANYNLIANPSLRCQFKSSHRIDAELTPVQADYFLNSKKSDKNNITQPLAGSTDNENQVRDEITLTLYDWILAWQEKSIVDYLSFYSSEFKLKQGISRSDWVERRKKALQSNHQIKIDIKNINLSVVSSTYATTTFDLHYLSDEYTDVTKKSMKWVKIGKIWQILEENADVITHN